MKWYNTSLPEIRPHWLRLLICVIYIPTITPFALIIGALLFWIDIVVPCITGSNKRIIF